MDFLKEILGDELYAQVAEKVNAHNGDEANKEKQIKLANLGGGEYVSKAKHDALQALLDGKGAELDKANGLIADLQKNAKGNEELQGKFTEYQTQVTELQEQLKKTQIESSLKIALLEAGATDIDYLIFKANSNSDKPLELSEDGKIKGVDDLISSLKTQLPNQFKKASETKVDVKPLPSGKESQTDPQTLAEALQMQYETNNQN